MPAEAKEKDKEKKKNPAVEWTKSIVMALALFFVIRTFLVQTYVITSGSMERTLLVGDMLVVNRLAIGSRIPGTQIRIPGYSRPHRGDVLVFDPHHEVDMMLVKRLIGLPGDTLEMRNAALFLNDECGLLLESGDVDAWKAGRYLVPLPAHTTSSPQARAQSTISQINAG